MKKKILFTVIATILSLSFYYFVDARAGGGGGGGGGGAGGGNGGGIGGLIITGLIYAVYEIRRRKMIAKAKRDLKKALAGDLSWNLEKLQEATKKVFMKYQEAWTKKDLDYVRYDMTKAYFEKATNIMNSKLKGKINILKNIKINKLTLMSVRDGFGQDGDMFAMEINARMIDYTIDEDTKKFVSSTLSRGKRESRESYESRAKESGENFKEYYIFIRHHGKWLLNNIKDNFSIVGDIIKLKEKDLRKILKKEESTDYINDDVFYKQ